MLNFEPATVKKISQKKASAGRNVHVPVFNMMEDIVVLQGDNAMGMELVTPCVVLPRANYKTIMSHWSRWSAYNGMDTGLLLDPEGALKPVVDAVQCKHVGMTRDAATTNGCISGALERALSTAPEHGLVTQNSATSFLDVCCFAHGAALATKPALERVAEVPSFCVRLGHALESGRNYTKLMDAVRSITKESFRYRRVRAYPPEFEAWGRRAREVLRVSRCCRDITPEAEESILCMLNGPWDDALIYHYCLIGKCTCGGQANALERTEAMIDLAFNSGPPVPLLYRWKAFAECAAWAMRASAMFSLLLRALQNLFAGVSEQEAEQRVLQALARGEEDLGARVAVRGQKLIKHLSADPQGGSLLKALVVNLPFQGVQHGSTGARCF